MARRSGSGSSGRSTGRGATGKATPGAAPPDFGAPGSGAVSGKSRKRSGIPRWARWCTVLGAILMVASGGLLVTSEALLARYEGAVVQEDLFGDGTKVEAKSDIKGPLNILLVGIDPRNETTLPLADSVMIMHIPEGLDRGYLFSLPRDTLVDIPPFPKAGYNGGREKLNAAMSHGARVQGGGKPDRAKGFELLSLTISQYTGIKRFDAGAIVNFAGFKKIVDAIGGVTMYVDEAEVLSEHLQPNGKARPKRDCNNCAHPYYGPQARYTKGTHKFQGWQALDYVRQRYTVDGGDYGRQRHQQQFVKAMAQQVLSKNVMTDLPKLDKVLRAAGESLVFSGRGHSVADFGFALKGMRQDSITMIKLPGGGVNENGKYAGEALQPVAKDFFASVRNETMDAFIASHPELVNTGK
ncbi:Anionic cell wall polymer biosynthesis enzyme, LytR-Cps2A-Psr (LCP) family [Asanoa hainanensis]|uniref:Anionic cell wall polymer biosynthesis enzyme, LytR-Cps2A-Psr (LCP) family n=1 Tax=Asanoa hainanensis TaxID=560556 RepID=A0A239JUF1_9ACTN|nr:LCP family protein [Asanoa hainanensis]SNT09527.1 Anionic cell wall polymer biosynthesis enzyme, LytR-Cps2A-Psr (LCP) family [Asanoa hainanensis]